MRGVRKYVPKCIDCGETERRRFYAHPTSRTGCQSRCKACDNRNRVERSPPGELRRARSAVNDLASLLPPDRWRLIRPETRDLIRALQAPGVAEEKK